MSAKKFYKLSLWEWSICVQRIRSLQNKREQDHELLIVLQRNWETRYFNAHRDKNTSEYNPTYFYQLPHEKVEEKKQEYQSPEQLEAEMKKRVQRRQK